MSGDVTGWLHRLSKGDDEALDELVPLLHSELRAVARNRLRGERRDHTLGTTGLVNEAYLLLQAQQRIGAEDRNQFLAVASNTMRRLLIDHARTRKRQKRGGGEAPIPLEEVEVFLGDARAEEILELDDALDRLAVANPEGAAVVQHRYFAGYSLDETAAVMNTSVRTVQRKWLAARAWLRKELGTLPELAESEP
ncbi:MAG: ECF-type sigma factor [Acidobacteriota bacterium]